MKRIHRTAGQRLTPEHRAMIQQTLDEIAKMPPRDRPSGKKVIALWRKHGIPVGSDNGREWLSLGRID